MLLPLPFASKAKAFFTPTRGYHSADAVPSNRGFGLPLLLTLLALSLLFTLGGTALVGLYHVIVYLIANAWSVLLATLLPTLILFCALGTIFLRNPVHNLLCLISVFFNTVVLYFAAEAEFLALIFLIIYIGAIAILFLFVIMLLNVRALVASARIPPRRVWRLALLTVGPLCLKLFLHFSSGFEHLLLSQQKGMSNADQLLYYVAYRFQDSQLFANTLYTEHSCLFVLISLLLLTAMLGAIVLATRTTERSGPQMQSSAAGHHYLSDYRLVSL